MNKSKIYADYQALIKMNATTKCKIRILEMLVAQGTNRWRVVGITEAALRKFAEQNFKYETRCGIQRAHIERRHSTYKTLLESNHDEKLFWNTIIENDKTILAIKGEYSSVSEEDSIKIPDVGLFPKDDSKVRFKALRVGFQCGICEAKLLKRLYQSLPS